MKLHKLFLYSTCAGLLAGVFSFSKKANQHRLPAPVMAESALIRSDIEYLFRDLNKNGKLDVYEDEQQPIEKRVQDLLKQMTLEEKAGMMFY